MQPTTGRHRTTAVAILVVLAGLVHGTSAHAAAGKAVWLCRPGLAANPCAPRLTTTRITTAGAVLGPLTVRKDARPRVDCFYVYPTVSGQPGASATKRIDPEERSIALYQAGRYSQTCRVYAPMYRQITLAGLLRPATVTPAISARAYADVRDAWREYLRFDNHGRGVVLIGHSQGTLVLRRLVAEEIDPKPTRRRQLVSAILLGGNVTVRRGSDVGGDFQHLRACRSARQLGCVVAFSTFNAPPPDAALFGRPGPLPGAPAAGARDLEVLCTNPAALGGGPAKITPVFPAAPFAAGTAIGLLTRQTGFPMPAVDTAFEQADDAYTARCSAANGARVLLLQGAEALKALPDATWGLHLTDANIALGDLAALVRSQAAAYADRRRGGGGADAARRSARRRNTPSRPQSRHIGFTG